MADDSNFDSWNKDQWKLHNKNDLNSLLLTGASGEPQNFGLNKINHLLDEIICNRPSSQQEFKKKQLRRFNSAIHAEPIKSNCDEFAELTTAFSNISINDNKNEVFNIYHCERLVSSTPSSLITTTNQSKSLTRVQRRCRIDDNVLFTSPRARDQPEVQRYSLNGHKVIRSSTSLSSYALSNTNSYSQTSMARNRAHFEWIQRKKQDLIRQRRTVKLLKMKKKIEEEQSANEKAERERKDHENFLIWLERKKKEDECKRSLVKQQLTLEQKFRDFETQTVPIKEFYFRQWKRKKDKLYKAQEEEQKFKIKKREEEKKKRLEESVKAFKIWCEKSKGRPRPATQGLLPHQRATPSYINPVPWIFDDTISEMQKDTSDTQTSNIFT